MMRVIRVIKLCISFPLIKFIIAIITTTIPTVNCYAHQNNVIGNLLFYQTKQEDNFYDLARKFDVGIEALIYANPKIDPWLPPEGINLIIPTMHILPSNSGKDIVINKAELRLYFFPKTNNINQVISFPVGIGTQEHETPIGTTKIVKKQKKPYWAPPKSIKKEDPSLFNLIPPGPNNPLGDYALYLGWNGVIIHGTNKPWGIGSYTTHGCIRMWPEDIKILFNLVNPGTTVRVVDEPIKLGWLNNELYLEAIPSTKQKYQIEVLGYVILTDSELANIKYKINTKAGIEQDKLDWSTIKKALEEHRGIPIKITS